VDKNQFIEILRKRLKLPEDEFQKIVDNPKYQKMFEHAPAGARYQLVAEVIESKGCHSGHVVGQKIIFDSSGNLLTKESPDRVCAFLMPHLTMVVTAFFENIMNGRDPNEVMFNRTGCFDVGVACGGWGRVVVEMKAVPR